VQTSSWGEMEYFKPEYVNFKQGDTANVWYDVSKKQAELYFVTEYPKKELLNKRHVKKTIEDIFLSFIPIFLVYIFRFASKTTRENKIRKWCFWAYVLYVFYFFGTFDFIF
jgi:hypothetical protein